MHRALSVVTQSILLQWVMGHCACSHVALSRHIMFSVSLELLSPREIQCSALVAEEDVVIMLMWVGSSECATSTVLNGQCLRKSLAFCAWIRWVGTVLLHVATKRSMLVASLSLSMLVGRDAHSACNSCASLLSFQAAALLHGHSVDVSGHQPRNQFLGPPEWLPEPTGEFVVVVLLRVGPPQFEPSADRVVSSVATVDFGLGFTMDLPCSRTVPAGDIPSCPQVPCGVCGDPSHMVIDSQSNERWNWCTRCQTRVGVQSSGSSSDVVLAWSSCQYGSIVRVG